MEKTTETHQPIPHNSNSLSVAMLAGFCPQGVSLADIPITLPKVNAAGNISNPRIVKDSSMEAGQKVTWDCVYFGSYPQSEVTSQRMAVFIMH